MPKRKQKSVGKSPFSIRMAALRKEKGLNMEKLAEQIGVSKSYISLLESGGRQPSREVVLKLAEALHSGELESLRDELLVLSGFAPLNVRAISAYQNALQSYEQALSEQPDNFQIYSRFIMALVRSERYTQAQERIQTGLQRFTETVQMQSLLAQLELSKGNYQAALINQETALKQFEVQPSETVQRSDLSFNLGAIYFMQAHQQMPEAAAGLPEARQQALAGYQQALTYFEEALAEAPDDVYIQDEYARLLFNRAYLLQHPSAWEETIQAYRRLLTNPKKEELGPQPLMESAAFLAHAYTQAQRYDQAELTLGLLSAFKPDYWLVHYLQACLHSQRQQMSPSNSPPDDLEQGLLALRRALEHDTSADIRTEAKRDPDLTFLRKQRPLAFEKLLKENQR